MVLHFKPLQKVYDIYIINFIHVELTRLYGSLLSHIYEIIVTLKNMSLLRHI